jgi:hypothetical protein
MLHTLGCLQRETKDYPAAAASLEQALDMMRELDDRPFQGTALDDLGRVQQLTGDYAASLTSHTQALALHRELGYRIAEAEALNSLGELSTRTSATGQARDYHTQALAIARSVGVPMTEACALEGIGRSHLHDGEPGQAAGYLQQALTIYHRIGVPGARHVRLALHRRRLTPTTAGPPANASQSGSRPAPVLVHATGAGHSDRQHLRSPGSGSACAEAGGARRLRAARRRRDRLGESLKQRPFSDGKALELDVEVLVGRAECAKK